MSPSIRSITFVAALFGSLVEAHATSSPVLSFSPLVYLSGNAGTLFDTSSFATGVAGVDSYSHMTGPQIGFHTNISPPGAGIPGSIDVYQDSTTSTETHTISYYNDNANYSVTDNSGSYAGGQWIELSGRLLALSDISFKYDLSVSGHYLTNNIPGVGNVTPALPSLFMSFGEASLQNIGAITLTNPGIENSYSVSSNVTSPYVTLVSGTYLPFSALVYVNGNATLENFGLNIASSKYGYQDVVTSSIAAQSNLVASVDIPALSISPVPEPAAFPMMAIGVLIVWRAARRKRNAKFKI